jgi:hypothetical protein
MMGAIAPEKCRAEKYFKKEINHILVHPVGIK